MRLEYEDRKIKKYKRYGVSAKVPELPECLFVEFECHNCFEHMKNVCKSFACRESRKLCADSNPRQSLFKGLKTHLIEYMLTPITTIYRIRELSTARVMYTLGFSIIL